MLDELKDALSAQYAIERELGGGGMSRVFLAVELALKRRVVIKVLPRELFDGGSFERFEREILVAAQLQHPHIVPVLSAGVAAGVPYYTMPFVEGDSLRSRLASGTPLGVAEAVSILRDVARALAFAHAKNVIHRDIKPDNVLLTGATASVADFGIAKALSASRTQEIAISSLTQAGMSIGTPAYMAPEQIAGDPDIDALVDTYAWGCMAYELLTGVTPFAGRAPQQTLAAHLAERPKSLDGAGGDAPAPLAALVMRCLAKTASERPTTDELVAALSDPRILGAGVAPTPVALSRILPLYAVGALTMLVVVNVATKGIGLPDWAMPLAVAVAAGFFPFVLWTAYVQRVAKRAAGSGTVSKPGAHAVAPQGTLATMAMRAAPRTSWSRTTRFAGLAVAAVAGVLAIFLGMRAFNIGPAATLLGNGQFAARDRIVMTDFSAAANDTALSRVVSFAVRSALEQSRVMQLEDEASMSSALRNMERASGQRLTLDVARELAQRVGAKAVLDGSLTAVGTGYLLSIRLLSADSARVLATVQAPARDSKELLDAADQVARTLRGKVGESLRLVQNAVPLRDARTASIEALRHYSRAMTAHYSRLAYKEAESEYRLAVKLDSNFAEAWRGLGTVGLNARQSSATSDSAFRRAYALRDRVDERARARIEGTYFAYTGWDRDRAISAYRSVSPYFGNNLGNLLTGRRQLVAAESAYRMGIAQDSTNVLPHSALVSTQLQLGHLSAADSTLALTLRRFPTYDNLSYVLIRSFGKDLASFERSLDSVETRGSANAKRQAITFRRADDLLRGRERAWMSSRRSIPDSSRSANDLATDQLISVQLFGTAGDFTSVEAALRRTPLRTVYSADRPDLTIARIVALAGNAALAKEVLAGYAGSVTDSAQRRAQRADFNTAQAAIALAEKRYPEALALFRQGDSLPDGAANSCQQCLFVRLARTFDAAGNADSAIVFFEKALAVPRATWLNRTESLSQLPAIHERLGQLYEQVGKRERAVEQLRQFVELWVQADPRLQPRVADARARIARLTTTDRAR